MPKRSSTRLTKRAVDAISTGQEKIVFDSDLPGFGVRVLPSGRKSFVVQYRNSEGRTRRLALGTYSDAFTVDQARKKATAELTKVEQGGDPSAARREEHIAETVEALAARYLTRYAARHKKPRSAEEDSRNLRLHVVPALGARKVCALTRQDIEGLIAKLSVGPDGEPMRVRANRVHALLSKMLGLAEEWNLRPAGSNPCRGIPKNHEHKHERYLSSEEVAGLWRALAEAEASGEIWQAVALFKLLLLTGRRLSEVLTLRWSAIDFERRLMRLADSKTGATAFPLNSAALAVLATLPRVEGSPYVLPAPRGGTYYNAPQRAWQRIRSRAGLADVRIHDLRHGFASVLAGLGESLPIIGKTLGHRQAATTQRYAHLADDPVRSAVERAGAALMGMAERRKAELVEISKLQELRRG
jgi:integrase